jgi:hypothetical protein
VPALFLRSSCRARFLVRTITLLVLLVFAACSCLTAGSIEQTPPTVTPAVTISPSATATPTAMAPSPTPSIVDAAEVVKRYTVLIVGGNRDMIGAGSGIYLGDGKVLTNNHVVAGLSEILVRFADGFQEPTRVLRTDRRRDLALLKTSTRTEPAAPIGNARSIRPAETLLAVGYPRSLCDPPRPCVGAQDSTVTTGIFSALWQSPQGVWHVQTNALVNHGNSGGPLTDSHGNVIGVVTWGIPDATGLNFAVASDEVQAFLEDEDVLPIPPSENPRSTVGSPVPPTSTAVRAVPIATTPRIVLTSPTVGQASSSDSAQTVRQFYSHIGARDFQAAWNLLGPAFRSKNQYDGWVKGFENTRSVQTIAVATTSQSRDKATVEVTIISEDTMGSQQVTKRFQGTWDLVLVDGGWKLDVPIMRQID